MKKSTHVAVRAYARLVLCSCAIATALTAFACSSPIFGKPQKANFTLNFIVSGMNQGSPDAASGSGDGSRLLLPTASTLTVTLNATERTHEARTRTVASGSEIFVPVDFSAIPMGGYTVIADAKDASGSVIFTQTSS